MGDKILPHGIFEIYKDFKGRLFTQSLLQPAKSHFAERIVKSEGKDYREWDPKRSKLAASVKNGCSNTGIRKNDVILYLGASHGYTPSYVSDMVGKDGLIFALDLAPTVLRDLVFLGEDRKNIVPIFADANHPELYIDKVCQVDVVYQDLAQRNQAEIFLKNCELFLKEGGFGLLAVKAKSIDVKRKSKDIFVEVRDLIEKKFIVVDFRDLEPFEKDHCMIIIKKKEPLISPNSKKNGTSSSSSNSNNKPKEISIREKIKSKINTKMRYKK
ncbi:MAG: fibrillarin-like rRNA/tRNA 2'-O-methyltransferase [archaeon]